MLKPISLWQNEFKAGYPEWVLAYALSAELDRRFYLLFGIYTRWVSLYTLQRYLAKLLTVRKNFCFTDAGREMPLVWANAIAATARARGEPIFY